MIVNISMRRSLLPMFPMLFSGLEFILDRLSPGLTVELVRRFLLFVDSTTVSVSCNYVFLSVEKWSVIYMLRVYSESIMILGLGFCQNILDRRDCNCLSCSV